MAGSTRDSRSSSEFPREILNDWNPMARESEVSRLSKIRPAGETPSARGFRDCRKGRSQFQRIGPHFSWDLFDRMDSGIGPGRLSSQDEATRQTRALLEGFELESSQSGL